MYHKPVSISTCIYRIFWGDRILWIQVICSVIVTPVNGICQVIEDNFVSWLCLLRIFHSYLEWDLLFLPMMKNAEETQTGSEEDDYGKDSSKG